MRESAEPEDRVQGSALPAEEHILAEVCKQAVPDKLPAEREQAEDKPDRVDPVPCIREWAEHRRDSTRADPEDRVRVRIRADPEDKPEVLRGHSKSEAESAAARAHLRERVQAGQFF